MESRPLPFIPTRLKIHEVAVVPMFAPMITPTVSLSVNIPAFTSPTSITVTAELDWMTAVTPAPRHNPLKLLEVRRASEFLSLSPVCFSSARVIHFMPNIKRASPKTNKKIWVTSSISNDRPLSKRSIGICMQKNGQAERLSDYPDKHFNKSHYL